MNHFILTCILVLFISIVAHAQGEEPAGSLQQNLEDLSESMESDADAEDEYDAQQLTHFRNHRLSLNGPRETLSEFPLIDALQLENLMQYRRLLGDLISVYELQAIPGFTPETIKIMLPYVTVEKRGDGVKNIRGRFSAGDASFVFRPSMIPEISKGFLDDKKYMGGRQKMLLRYKYQYRDLLQYGFLGEQDAGEPFTFSNGQKGFDFYSFHLFARKAGRIKALAVGDYTINLGQGLIQWQSQAFKKSSGVINIKRQSEVVRPYHSAGEYNFFRGAAVTIRERMIEASFFASRRKLSANTGLDNVSGPVITSVLTSGFHRTVDEIAGKNKLGMTVFGSNVKWLTTAGHAGVSAVWSDYSIPLKKRDVPYNLFAVKGNKWANYSSDFSFGVRNFHVFGEVAADGQLHTAFLAGTMASVHQTLDVALLFRRIAAAYQSVYGNAFTENSMPSNENGAYFGISFRPVRTWTIDMHGDVFSFPWLRYRADGPGFGSQFLLQATWRASPRVEVYSRLRVRTKPLNSPDLLTVVNYPEDRLLKNWRTHVEFQLNRDVLIRTRMEFCWYAGVSGETTETGFLIYNDLLYKPFGKGWSMSARIQTFETGGYDTRLYAFENDLLFTSSTPAFFGNGSRVYANLKMRIKPRRFRRYGIDIGLKAATSIYSGQTTVGSGGDEIAGNRKSEVKFQVFFSPGS